MSFRILDQHPQYRDNSGNICASGTLYFYETGTSTPKNVYGEEALSTNNGSSLTLNTAGRTDVDVWGSGEYRVVLKKQDGTTVWTRDHVRDVATAAEALPTDGTDGQVLFTDGVDPYWDDIRQVPDPSGSSGKYLTNDGAALSWGTITIPTYSYSSLPGGITATSSAIRIGNVLIQLGSDTVPSAASQSSSKAVTFATAYTATPKVFIEANTIAVTAAGAQVCTAATSVSATGFTCSVFAGNEHGSNDYNLTSNISFSYIAIGSVA